MLGTEVVPSLHLPQELEVLPLQNDDYNCGINIRVAIAIILCNVVYVDEKDEKLDVVYEGTFSQQCIAQCHMGDLKDCRCQGT